MPKVHVIGAGLAGLAAAVELADGPFTVEVHEAARQAGGRCRSYHDAVLDMTIDNGNHLLLSGNHAARAFLRKLGTEDQLVGPAAAVFSFVDLANGRGWQVRPNKGALPWWIFSSARRVPGTRFRDYFTLARLLRAGGDRPIGEVIACEGRLYDALWHPFLLAALNTEPPLGSSALAAAVIRETLAKGGAACRPLVAAQGLSSAFVEPALHHLARHGVAVAFDRRLRGLRRDEAGLRALDFGDGTIMLEPEDRVILAVPAPVAVALLPDISAPQTFRSIVNGHFKIAPPAGSPGLLGVVNATTEWIFTFPDRISVTISGADRLLDVPRETLAGQIWGEIAKALNIAAPLPAWQIIKERRATFAATPAENRRRPPPVTSLQNLVLAGDWTATGLPATIEGAIRSGVRAAAEIRRSAVGRGA
jgi:squalene-associated FAD-dependent desaturase